MNLYITARENAFQEVVRQFSVQYNTFYLQRVWLCRLAVFMHWTGTQTTSDNVATKTARNFNETGLVTCTFLFNLVMSVRPIVGLYFKTSFPPKKKRKKKRETKRNIFFWRAEPEPLETEIHSLTRKKTKKTATAVRPSEKHFLLQWYVHSYNFWVFRKIRWVKESEISFNVT